MVFGISKIENDNETFLERSCAGVYCAMDWIYFGARADGNRIVCARFGFMNCLLDEPVRFKTIRF